MRQDLQPWFWVMVGLFAVADGLSWISFQSPSLMPWIFGLILLGLLGLGLRWPWLPALVGLGELTVGGKGYLWFLTIGPERVSFRIGLFGLVMLLSFWHWWRSRPRPQIPLGRPVILLLAWVAIMAAVGWFKGYGLSGTWLDANGWLFVSIIFAWTVLWPKRTDWRDWVLAVVLAGVTYLGIKTWLMAVLFSHQPEQINQIYRWIRNSGVGEITLIRDSAYRIFFQSHVYSLFGLLITLAGFVWRRAPRWWMWPMLAGALGTYISWSRRFWVGLAAGLLVLVIISLGRLGWRQQVRWLILVPLAGSVWLLATWAYHWPYVFPSPGTSGQNIVMARLTAKQSTQASNARLNQLEPLRQAILQSPLIGHGFGTTLTYYSTDPRVRGWRTTAAFELGYLDFLLKAGVVGLGLLAWLTVRLMKLVWRSSTPWLWIGGLTALYVLHLTTPYLNHPLGLGWVALAAVYAAGDR